MSKHDNEQAKRRSGISCCEQVRAFRAGYLPVGLALLAASRSHPTELKGHGPLGRRGGVHAMGNQRMTRRLTLCPGGSSAPRL